MKLSNFFIILALLLAVSCSTSDEILIEVINLSDQQRDDATVLLNRAEISNLTEIPEGKLPILKSRKGENLPCQVDDVNGDGMWDELFAPIDMSPLKQKTIILSFIDPADYPEFKNRTNIRLGDASRSGYPEMSSASRLEGISFHNYSGVTSAAYQMEGVAWENDKVGFRNYMDQRNGMDIFGKLSPEMVLDSVGVAGSPSYHEPDSWGMDVLKVGTSLGAGGIGYLYKDSIYRVGDNGSGTFQVVFEGSQRSRFNLNYNNWSVDGSAINVLQQIEISAGKHYYQSTVSYSGSDSDLDLVVGIVNMKSKEVHVVPCGDHHTALLTHDRQAEDTTLLAMALMVPNQYLIKHGESKEQGEGITQTYYVVLEANEGDPLSYRFYSLWEKEDLRWASLDQVVAFLEEEAARWTQSVAYKMLN
jgi:hypothetical protein